MKRAAIGVVLLTCGCFGNGMGGGDMTLTDAEVHELTEGWLGSEHRNGGVACTWAAESDSTPGIHRCVQPDGSTWTATYDLRPGEARKFTISSRFVGYECRLNGHRPAALGRLGCWMVWRY